MSAVIGENRYGKARVRVVKVITEGEKQTIINYTAKIQFAGDFDSSYVTGDNSLVVPTDTIKNTVFAKAKESFNSPEEFALILGKHFLARYKHVKQAFIDLEVTPWKRMIIDGKEHPFSFERGTEKRTVKLIISRENTILIGGITDLVVLKTRDSGFAGFHLCEYTTLIPVTERILATNVTTTWKYNSTTNVNYNEVYQKVRDTVTHIFATEYSVSVQATMWSIGTLAIKSIPSIDEIYLSLPNLHHWIVDTSRFANLSNNNDIFIASDEPHGIIEATIKRAAAKL